MQIIQNALNLRKNKIKKQIPRNNIPLYYTYEICRKTHFAFRHVSNAYGCFGTCDYLHAAGIL